MEFRLIYDGRLPAASRTDTRNTDKDRIRRLFSKQLAELFQTHPALIGWNDKKTELRWLEDGPDTSEDQKAFWRERLKPNEKYSTVDLLAFKHARCDRRYVPLIDSRLGVACSLDILFLRRDQPGNLIVSGGDLDNRIKVLFDALRMPQNCAEVATPPSGEQIDDPTFVLLEDDRLIVDVKVTSDRLLTPRLDEEHINDVRLIIHVKTVVLDATKGSSWVF